MIVVGSVDSKGFSDARGGINRWFAVIRKIVGLAVDIDRLNIFITPVNILLKISLNLAV